MKTIEMREKMQKIYGGVPTKLPISQLLIFLYNLTWYKISATKWHLLLMVLCSSYLVSIFMNINEDIRNRRGKPRKMKGRC